MKTRFFVILGFALLILLIFGAMEVEAEKRAIRIKELLDSNAQYIRLATVSKKAELQNVKEQKEMFLMEKAIARHIREEEQRKAAEEAERKRIEESRKPNYPGGGHLTPSAGVFYFGNQRETYYNLDMSWIVSYARQNGISGEYWIRSDGCKMLGDYIILACNRDVHPYGSIVQTSLGIGISLDTGGFAYDYPYGVDIAVNW